MIHFVESTEIEVIDDLTEEQVLSLLPKEFRQDFYWGRTDRNIGFITEEEQEILRNTTVGIAGCGGMGAAVAQVLLRAGVGEIRIADPEKFDVSNINRQAAAGIHTLGQNKALATAGLLRGITHDTKVVVYPQGITEATVDAFVDGCDVVIDEIEFFALSAAIILHQAARAHNVPILGGNVCGFGAHVFLFTPTSMKIEDMFGLSLEEAKEIDVQMRDGTIDPKRKEEILQMLVRVVAPHRQEYSRDGKTGILKLMDRLREGKVPIVATTPPFASGFVCIRFLLYLLRNSGVERDIVELPETPEYLYIDGATMPKKGSLMN